MFPLLLIQAVEQTVKLQVIRDTNPYIARNAQGA